MAPPATAPQIESPPFQISTVPMRPLSLHLYPVNRWYTRAPTTPAITTGMTIALNSLASRPLRTQRVSATLTAASTPMASMSP